MNINSIEQELLAQGISQFDYFPQVGSTNDVAKTWLEEGHAGIYVALADEQVSGKGRSGRKWQSPPGSAIALSLGFSRGKIDNELMPLMAGITGIACCVAVSDLWGLNLEIKWPNDLVIEKHKVGGILIETDWQGQQNTQTVIGIGINVAKSSVEGGQEFRFPASYLEAYSKEPLTREFFVGRLTKEILNLVEKHSPESIIDAWNNRLAFKNSTLLFELAPGKSMHGSIEGIDESGRLIILDQGGKKSKFSVGEIRSLSK
jgi:BirA family biotin operon repressor/biotin-[acetyl-CoA-carboxylase] ligase